MIEREFGIVAARHRGELLRHCARMLGSYQDAEDALQETFLRAWHSLRTYRNAAPPRVWLYRIATNVCCDHLARRRRTPAPLEQEHEPFAPAAQQPDAVVIAAETVALALAAARHLPPRQRACLVLRDVLRWPAAETAAALSLSVPAANSAVQRARDSLRAHLAADRDDWAYAT